MVGTSRARTERCRLLETSPRAEGERGTCPSLAFPFALHCPTRGRLLGSAPPAPVQTRAEGCRGASLRASRPRTFGVYPSVILKPSSPFYPYFKASYFR